MVLVEAGSLIQARDLTEFVPIKAAVIRDVLWYASVHDMASKSSRRRKSYTLKLKLEAGEPSGSNRSRVSNTSRGLLLKEIWYALLHL